MLERLYLSAGFGTTQCRPVEDLAGVKEVCIIIATHQVFPQFCSLVYPLCLHLAGLVMSSLSLGFQSCIVSPPVCIFVETSCVTPRPSIGGKLSITDTGFTVPCINRLESISNKNCVGRASTALM